MVRGGRELVDVLQACLGGLVPTGTEGKPGVELYDRKALPLRLNQDVRAHELGLEVAAVGETPVLLGHLFTLDLRLAPDDLKRARERRPRIALLEVDAHLRERRLDVPVRGQNEVPSVEYLEEGIYAALGDRAVDLGHRRRPG